MFNQKDPLFYCFNPNCANSIANVEIPFLVRVNIQTALVNNLNCSFCAEELISPILNLMTQSILELINNEQTNVMLLDDDLMFHHFVKKLFNEDLINASYFTDGFDLLNKVASNIDNEQILPDIIFLDLNMPVLDGWAFLELFKTVTKNLTKEIEIYIISNSIESEIDLSLFPFVKCFISKSLTIRFFKSLNLELAERKSYRPIITLNY
ncbi:response regulator [Mucilaginibacter sp.]